MEMSAFTDDVSVVSYASWRIIGKLHQRVHLKKNHYTYSMRYYKGHFNWMVLAVSFVIKKLK